MKNHAAFMSRVFLFALVCFVFSFGQRVEGAETGTKTVRVAFPIQEGLTMCNERGEYSGYTYDYLMEIAQYTGWKYEFVQIEGDTNQQLVTLMEMLKNGEVDIMGATYMDESLAEVYTYQGYSYGTNYQGLFVPDGSDLTETNIYSRDIVRVGVFSRALKNSERLDTFAKTNNLNIEQVLTDSYEDYKRMVITGKADALLSTDLALSDHKGMHAVIHFSPSPFYFMATKGRVDLTRQLDYALSTIDQVNPDFSVELFNKYFSPESNEIHITEEEQKFIRDSESFKVVMYDNKPPFQFIDKETGKPAGITVEIFKEISNNTDLKFTYITVSSFEKYQEMLSSGKVDISADSLLNYEDAVDSGCTLTVPWATLPVYYVFQNGAVMEEDSQYAVPYFLRNIVPDEGKAVYYDTVYECMQAVSKGTVDGSYVGEFCSQYYFNSGEFQELKFLNQQESMKQKLCFGIRNTDDYYLLSIMNKAISNIPEERMQELVYRNTYKKQEVSLSVFFLNNKGKFGFLALIFMAAVFICYIVVKNRKQQQIAFENQRYNTLSNLVNEFFYEYDIHKDILVLADKCADYFQCEKKIDKFAVKLRECQQKERTGIWQLGEHVVSASEGSVELSCLMPDDTRKWMKVVSARIYQKKNYAYTIGKIVDIQDIKAEQIRLKQQASLDGLTGIYNISTIKKKISQRLEALSETDKCGLIILDVDNFKQVNDQFGHYNGDAVLVQVADLIKEIFIKDRDLAGRLGGDEFIIFLEGASREEIEERCQLMCKRTAEKIKIILGVASTVSIGIAVASVGQGYEELYRNADQALYQTKSSTKNGYTFYS